MYVFCFFSYHVYFFKFNVDKLKEIFLCLCYISNHKLYFNLLLKSLPSCDQRYYFHIEILYVIIYILKYYILYMNI